MWLDMTWVPAAPGASATLLLAPGTAGTEVPQAPAALPQAFTTLSFFLLSGHSFREPL